VFNALWMDSPDQLAQPLGEIKDWRNGDTELVPGKTFPNIAIVERDYTKIYDKLVSLGPLVCKPKGYGSKGQYTDLTPIVEEELKNNEVLDVKNGRVYFEKPRTTVGWKGLINDPHLNDTFDIEHGLQLGRKLLLDINELGLPVATEALDPISPQYLQDTIAWSAIGARTTESQTHREMSSGLSMAIGFKNGTDGSLDVAVNAMKSVSYPHSFLGIDQQGQVAIIRTKGNRYGHVVLRGGGGKPNYDSVSVALCEQALDKTGLRKSIMVDCSHANSSKDPAIQPLVMQDVSHQILDGNTSIQSLMIESNINWGSQPLTDNLADLKYGVSVTDACIDWETTEKAIHEMRNKLKDALPGRGNPG
ncbi:hypothetical protein LCGC14_0884250, partial [marine sediment metagenome]